MKQRQTEKPAKLYSVAVEVCIMVVRQVKAQDSIEAKQAAEAAVQAEYPEALCYARTAQVVAASEMKIQPMTVGQAGTGKSHTEKGGC